MHAIIAALLTSIALAVPAIADEPVRTGPVARVYGCPTEDSCRIDYRVDRQGRPVWVISAQRP